MILEPTHFLLGIIKVVEHSLALFGHLNSTGHFNLCDQQLLSVVALALVVEQALGEQVAIDIDEHVLIREMSEQVHKLFQELF